MTTAATSLLGLALPVTGELSGTWGDTVNNSITSLLDTAVAGTTTLSTDSDVTLSTTTLAANQARQAIILWTANGTTTRNITAPAQSKIYTVINASAGTQSIVLRGVGPTTGVTIVKGESAVCAWNGSDFIKISNTAGAGVFSSITNTSLTSGRVVYSTTGGLETDSSNLTFDGTTLTAGGFATGGSVTLSGGSANGVLYLNGSKVATSGSALTFDGQNLGVDTGGAYGASYATFTLRARFGYDGSNVLISDAGTGKDIVFTRISEQMRLTSTGLGIGTSSPGQKLTVAGGNIGLDNDYVIQAKDTSGIYRQAFVPRAASTNATYIDGGTGGLYLRTNNGSTSAAYIDTSGNLGLGVTPSAWGGTYKAIQIGNGGSIFGRTNVARQVGLSANVYNNGSGNLYIASEAASQYQQDAGAHYWYSAASGTAGNAISFTQAMTLSASSELNIDSGSGGGRFTFTPGGAANTISSTTTGYGAFNLLKTYASSYQWFEGGTQAMTLDASGNLGIGTTSPSRNLAIYGSSLGAIALQNSSTGTASSDGFQIQAYLTQAYIWNYENDFMSFGTNATERARIDSSGNLLVGITSGSYKFMVGDGTRNMTINPNNILDAIFFGTTTNKPLVFGTNDTERARIDSSGNLLVGTTSSLSSFSGARATFVGTTGFVAQTNQDASYECGAFWHPATSGNNTFAIFGTEATYTNRGSITYNRAGGLVAYNVTSDYRAKDISGPVENSGALIDSVPVYMGKMKGATQERPMFIAHETPAYAHTGEKDAVDAKGNPVYQQMDASALIPVMWAEIQSLRARVAALES